MRLDIKCWGTLWSLLALPHGYLIIILSLSHTMTCNCFRVSDFFCMFTVELSMVTFWKFTFKRPVATCHPCQYSCPKVVKRPPMRVQTDGQMDGHTHRRDRFYTLDH